MFLPTPKQAVSKRLMHMQSICNVLFMSVTYFSLSATTLRFFYIFWKSKVKQFWKTWWMDWEDRYQTELWKPSWQSEKHAELYFDLLQALKWENFTALGSQHREPYFFTHSMPLQANKQNHKTKSWQEETLERRKIYKTFLKRKEPQMQKLLNKQ